MDETTMTVDEIIELAKHLKKQKKQDRSTKISFLNQSMWIPGATQAPAMVNPIWGELDKIVFPRQFRFLFVPDSNHYLQFWIQAVSYDIVKKEMNVSAFETQDNQSLKWAINTVDNYDNATLTAYDGCGNALYTLRFEGMQLMDHSCGYTYADSGVVTHNCKFSFMKCQIKE